MPEKNEKNDYRASIKQKKTDEIESVDSKYQKKKNSKNSNMRSHKYFP